MERHDAWSDWDNTISESKKVAPDAERQLKALRTAHQELADLARTDWFTRLCRDMVEDINRWLDQEPSEPNFLAIYPEDRIVQVFARHPKPAA